MNLLIIGSKGFIGSHVIKFFREENQNVYGCDVVVDYGDNKYFQIDSTNSNYNDIFASHAFDYCINCSGAASVPDSLKNPRRDYELNTVNVYKILEAIRSKQPNCKLINMSSAAVYGNPESLPIKENQYLRPISPYGMHKLYAEQICKEYHDFFDITSVNLRIFSAYGPGLKKQLFWDLYKKCTSNSNQIKLFGTGLETRDFIYVNDIAKAVLLIIKNDFFNQNVINLASGIDTTIRQAASVFVKSFNWDGEVIFSGSEREGDPSKWKSDISKLKELGFKTSYTLEDGLFEYVKWIRKQDLK